MNPTKGPAPGFVNNPDHVVGIAPSDDRWRVHHGESVLADSRRTLVVEETGCKRAIYFPLEDVSMERLVRTDNRTTCPFKGEAHYFVPSVTEDSQPIAWTYPSVYDEMVPIEGYLAFYEDRVNLRKESTDDN